MADRVKYFLLGVLFLVVAGVIAYDKWNSAGEPEQVAKSDDLDTGSDVEVSVRPPDNLTVEPGPAAKTGQNPVAPFAVVPPDQRPPSVVPEPVEAPVPQPKPEPPPAKDRTHVIQKGETLEAIAVKYYGTREGISWIASANGLANANKIFENQKLIIPARKEMTKAGGSGSREAEKTAEVLPSRYRVKEGENLYAIARRFYGSEGQGARVARIMELNHLWSAEVKAGTVLILPPR